MRTVSTLVGTEYALTAEAYPRSLFEMLTFGPDTVLTDFLSSGLRGRLLPDGEEVLINSVLSSGRIMTAQHPVGRTRIRGSRQSLILFPAKAGLRDM